jgi:hypothetical protein
MASIITFTCCSKLDDGIILMARTYPTIMVKKSTDFRWILSFLSILFKGSLLYCVLYWVKRKKWSLSFLMVRFLLMTETNCSNVRKCCGGRYRSTQVEPDVCRKSHFYTSIWRPIEHTSIRLLHLKSHFYTSIWRPIEHTSIRLLHLINAFWQEWRDRLQIQHR